MKKYKKEKYNTEKWNDFLLEEDFKRTAETIYKSLTKTGGNLIFN